MSGFADLARLLKLQEFVLSGFFTDLARLLELQETVQSSFWSAEVWLSKFSVMATPHDPLLESFVRPEGSSRRDDSSKAWRRSGWVILATLSCIALLATTTFRYRPVEEPMRVTHVRSTTRDIGLRGDLANYLHRTSFHFQPEKNWMNGRHITHFSSLHLPISLSDSHLWVLSSIHLSNSSSDSHLLSLHLFCVSISAVNLQLKDVRRKYECLVVYRSV